MLFVGLQTFAWMRLYSSRTVIVSVGHIMQAYLATARASVYGN